MEKVNSKNDRWKLMAIKGGIDENTTDDVFDDNYYKLLPADKPYKKNSLLLEIGTRTGEWLIAAAKKKYISVGASTNLENARRALNQLRKQKVNGYVVVSDVTNLPFQDNLFDLMWSANIFRPANLKELELFSGQLHRILAKSGKIKLPFLVKKPINNDQAASIDFLHVSNGKNYLDDFTLEEFENVFKKYFPNASSRVHSCFGVTAYKENFKRVSAARKPLVGSVLLIEFLSRFAPAVKSISDSLFITAQKIAGPQNIRIAHFLRHHWLKQNLNVVYLLQCPISGGPVYLSKDAHFVISDKANVKYPVINEIPIMLEKAAIPIEHKVETESELSN